jgi:hypothetical protein
MISLVTDEKTQNDPIHRYFKTASVFFSDIYLYPQFEFFRQKGKGAGMLGWN